MTRSRALLGVLCLVLAVIATNIVSAYALLVRTERRLADAVRALERMRATVVELERRLDEIDEVLAPVAAVQEMALRYNPALADHAAGLAACVVLEARRHGLDPYLVAAVVAAESGWRPGAVSARGARGLMQLMPATAQALGVDLDRPAENVRGGVRYLRAQIERFGGTTAALAAYNGGPAHVSRGRISRGMNAYAARVRALEGRLRG